MQAAPDISHCFLTRVKVLGIIIETNTMTPLKSRIDAIQKLQPPSRKKKKIQNTRMHRHNIYTHKKMNF